MNPADPFFRADDTLWVRLIHTSAGMSWSAWHWMLMAHFAEKWWPPEAVPEHWGASRVEDLPARLYKIEAGGEPFAGPRPVTIVPVGHGMADRPLTLQQAFRAAKRVAGWRGEFPQEDTW